MALGENILMDDALWPLLHVRFVGVPSTLQFKSYLERMTSYLERGVPNVRLFDARGMTGVGPAEQRHLQAGWLKKHDARLRKLDLGTAFVITSPLVRLAVGVVFHLQPTASPYLITGKLGEAVAWAAERLREAGEHGPAERIRQYFESPPREK